MGARRIDGQYQGTGKPNLENGLLNADHVDIPAKAVNFVRSFAEAGKPIAAICHGPWVLIEAGLVKGRRLTSWPAIHSDIKNAGGDCVNEEVVLDNGLVTSRKPDDMPAFNANMSEEFCEAATKEWPRVRRPPEHER